MRTTTTAGLAAFSLAAVLSLSACGSQTSGSLSEKAEAAASSASSAAASASEDAADESDSGAGSGATTSSSPSSSSESEDSGSPSDSSTPVAFGQTFAWEDGLTVTVSVPRPYTPGEYAVVGDPPPPAYVAFDVTITNGTSTNYEPLFLTSMQSGGREEDEVYDENVGGTPSTTLLPGRDVTFTIAYGVEDPNDLVLQVTPGFDYDDALFTIG